MQGRARLKMDFGKTAVLTALLTLLSMSSVAQEISTEEYNPGDSAPTSELSSTLREPVKSENKEAPLQETAMGNGMIEIVYPVEIMVPYQERRPDHQAVFHFQYENFKPAAYENVVEGSAALMSLNVGYKYNLPLVGLEISGFLGSGGRGGGVTNTTNTNYSVQKKGIRLAAVFDDFMKEPYVAPYIGLQFVRWDVQERSISGSISASPNMVMGTQAGILIQLNSLEPVTALRALSDDGLNNSYLDLFIQQYGATEGINLASSFNWGAGFRLEY